MLEDLGALNGTQVDGLKLIANMPTPLTNGVKVRLGPFAFDVAIE